MAGLQLYFDRSLGANLLYRWFIYTYKLTDSYLTFTSFERVQYAEIRRPYVTGPTVKVGEEKEMSCIYGAEHLLRMIGMHRLPITAVTRKLQQTWYAVSLPSMIGNSNMDPETVAVLRDYVHELMGCVPPVMTMCYFVSSQCVLYCPSASWSKTEIVYFNGSTRLPVHNINLSLGRKLVCLDCRFMYDILT